MFETLKPTPPDKIIELMELYKADPVVEIEEIPDRRPLGADQRRGRPERQVRPRIPRPCLHLEEGDDDLDPLSGPVPHPVSTFRSG